MFKLTHSEKILIVCLMGSLLLGATVKHWRDLRRNAKPVAAHSEQTDRK